MARNFDDELPDDLTFIVAGETFTMELAAPSVLAAFEDADAVTTGAEAVQRAEERTTAFIQPGDRERWAALLKDGKVPYLTLQSLQTWMLEVQSGRPTQPPSPSDSGPGGTARTSKGRAS